MKFKTLLTEATLLRRYLGFLTEVALKNNKKRTIYCPNLSPLLKCDVLGSRVWFSNSGRLSRGYLDVWELVEVNGGYLVSIHPDHPKTLLMEAIEEGIIIELQGYRFLQMGIAGRGLKSDIELLLNQNGEQCFLCIEQVTLENDKGEGYFPEVRGGGILHLQELMTLRDMGHRTILFLCVTHTGIQCVKPAENIEPSYAKLLKDALVKGVEVLAYRSHISLQEMVLESRIPVVLSENILHR